MLIHHSGKCEGSGGRIVSIISIIARYIVLPLNASECYWLLPNFWTRNWINACLTLFISVVDLIMEAILQCRQPLWIDKCLLLTIFITSLYTDQLWHNCLILFVCLFSCAQLSLIANRTERTRGGKTWLQVSIVFCVVGPPMLNNRPVWLLVHFPSFLP